LLPGASLTPPTSTPSKPSTMPSGGSNLVSEIF
jgi:hypothetical protein